MLHTSAICRRLWRLATAGSSEAATVIEPPAKVDVLLLVVHPRERRGVHGACPVVLCVSEGDAAGSVEAVVCAVCEVARLAWLG